MKNKSLLLGTLVFGTGMVAGYFIGVKRVKAQYKNDLAEVKDFYAAKLDELGVQKEGFDPDRPKKRTYETDEDEVVEEMSEEYFNKVSNYSSAATGNKGERGKGRMIVNYNKPPLEVVAREALDPEDDLEPEEDDEDDQEPVRDEDYEAELEAMADELAQRRHENHSNGQPYVINHDEFEDAPDGYDRITLYYYSEDRTLCEDDDSVVEDEEELIGFDYEDTLEMQTTAWVRNDAIMNVYQIHRIDASYKKAVANVAETPREREFRILGRRKQGMDN